MCVELGITHFVDDRAEVLESLLGVVPHLYLFGLQSRGPTDGMVAVPTRSDAERAITDSLLAS